MTAHASAPPRGLSSLLHEIDARFEGRESLRVDELLEAFHERGFGFFLFLISLPAALPLPALGLNTIIAAPLMLLTAQQSLGFHVIWVPQGLKGKTIPQDKVQAFIRMALPWVARIEFFIRPRLGFLTQGVFSHLIGVLGLFMALSVAVPLPLTNTVPSFGICLMAVGVLMRDGLAVLAGATIGTAWVVMLIVVALLFGIEGFDLVKEWIKSLV